MHAIRQCQAYGAGRAGVEERRVRYGSRSRVTHNASSITLRGDGSGVPWERIGRVRVSRRRALAGGAAVTAGAAAVALVGCGGGKDARPDANPRSGGTLRTGTTLPLSSGLDPHLEQGTGLAIFPRVYGYLLHVDPRDDTVIKDHAESIEQPDASTTIVRLRGDVKFQDVSPVSGRPVNAEDAKLSIERFRDNQVALNRTWHATVLDKAEAVDSRTLRITTKRPYAYTLHALGDINAGAIIPKELIASQESLAFSGVGADRSGSSE